MMIDMVNIKQVCALKEIRWPGKGDVINNYMICYSGHKRDENEFGKGSYIRRHIMNNALDFERINEIICKIRVEHKY